MGKNQTHKQLQASKGGGGGAVGAPDDGKVDGTFHSPEWHAARVQELMAPRMTWEEYKGKQKETEREEERKRLEQEKLEVEYLKQVAAPSNLAPFALTTS